MLDLFRRPSQVFQGLKEKPDFLLPTFLIILISFFSFYQSRYSQELMMKQFPALPHSDLWASPSLLGIGSTTFIGLLLWLLKSLLHYGMAILFGGEGNFKTILSIIGYTYLPIMLQSLFSALTICFLGTPIALGAGLLIPVSEQLFTLKGLILSSINIFDLGMVLLLSIGLSIGMNLSKKRAFFISFFFWILGQGIAIFTAALSFRLLE